ncbi:hypothetical protein BC749_11617 [Flavobacterium araucananum]|uniref:Uncharacterized protein n=1 Tax=Flavobacterium araucananum TaxID=946678 RepID=A0A227P7F3_9FLAO|nr:hypothetical protein [Flavobacterium araucananum]OXG05344.1 hypothetical protein B0A64_13300 [Flavobacterium araucananum]PWJ93330.1 hypothetical protein BC749_11617 [Flavobacterium araucananum]
MKKTFYFALIVIITLSCSEKKTKKENIIIKNIKSDTVLKIDNEKLDNNSDCVFDDNYKKITEEWLNELEIKKYVWDSKSNTATLIYNGDTLTVYKGGCDHFISSVEIKTDIYPNKELDSTLIRKINDIACKFKFDNYCKKLIEGRFKKNINSNSSLFLEFEDDDPEDNLISEGIQILEKEKRTIITISEYYN